MNLQLTPDCDRREFLRSGIRYGCLTVIAVVVALTRRQLTVRQCVKPGVCGNCAVFAKCELPKALSAKRAATGGRS